MKTKSVELEFYKDQKITLKGNETDLFNFLCALSVMAYDANVYNINEGYTKTAYEYLEFFKQIREKTNGFIKITKED